MKISLLVPCYNEEDTLEACIQSCLNQTRPFDQLVFINDSSTDGTLNVLKKYKKHLTIQTTPQNTGNKSHAQEFGLQFVTGDIVVTTDADTLLDPHFAERIERDFQDANVAAVSGYVSSLPDNWLTLCRALEYVIGQNVHKLAQSYLQYMFVMPGAASAFRTSAFHEHITFDHDTITEDLDFTYKLHHKHLKILYDRQAISYTQDPSTLPAYINQLRRWYGGGWQNLLKHYHIIEHPVRAFELTLIYVEGVTFSLLWWLIPFLNPWIGLHLLGSYLAVAFLFASWAAYTTKRWTLLLAPVPSLFLMYINSYIFLERMFVEAIAKRHTVTWFKPPRKHLEYA